jgi:hypothetical protein
MKTVKLEHFPKAEYWDAAVIRESALEVLGDSKGTLKKLVTGMLAAFAKTKAVADCDKCGGRSSSSLARCPFCGDTDADEAVKESAAKTERALARKAVADVVPDIGTLDTSVRKIQKLKKIGYESWWEVGEECIAVQKNGSWMARVDSHGKPVHRSFDDWGKTELGLAKSALYLMIGLAKNFTRAQIEKYGKTHISILLTEKDEDRAYLINELEKQELTSRELMKLVNEQRVARKLLKRGKERKTERKTELLEAASKPIEAKTLTGIFPIERVELEMFARQHADADEPVRAANDMADQPWAKWSLNNGVDIFFNLQKRKDGQFVLAIQGVRDGDE